jgi:hypothetical protein
LVRLHTDGWSEPKLAAIAENLPVVVVKQHVVFTTQQDAVSDVGFAVVSVPVFDVVCLAPGHGPVAVFPPAAAVSHG